MITYNVTDHYDVVAYDDGWVVNDSREAGQIDLPDDATDGQILRALFADGRITSCPDQGSEGWDVGGDDVMITVDGPITDDDLYGLAPYYTLHRVAS